jgi:hypothetical protein
MIDFLENLWSWCQDFRDKSDLDIQIEFHRSPDWPKKSAWVVLEDARSLGQITVWETGEAELDLGSRVDPTKVLIKTEFFRTREDLVGSLETAIDFMLLNR